MSLKRSVGRPARRYSLISQRFTGCDLAARHIDFCPIGQSVPVVGADRLPVTRVRSGEDLSTQPVLQDEGCGTALTSRAITRLPRWLLLGRVLSVRAPRSNDRIGHFAQ